MSDEGGGGEKVTRLLDMVVEEVSLVDRAANKHRFLIVKRDDPMAKARAKDPKDEGDADADAAGDESPPPPGKKKRPFPPKASPKKPKAEPADDEDVDPEEADPEEEPAPPRRGRRGGAKKEAPDPMSALGLTLAALDKLATAVEELEDDEDEEAYAEVARDLRKASAAIAKAAGVELEVAEDEDADEEEEPTETEAPRPGDEAATGVLTAVRDMLTRLEGALASPGASPAPAPGAAPAAAGDGAVAKELRGIAAAVKAIDTSVRAQNARLGTLEKRTGLPNSQPPERAQSHRKETSWPFDINRPMDRSHVKKELSFHGDE